MDYADLKEAVLYLYFFYGIDKTGTMHGISITISFDLTCHFTSITRGYSSHPPFTYKFISYISGDQGVFPTSFASATDMMS
jgi:hypothetical protein